MKKIILLILMVCLQAKADRIITITLTDAQVANLDHKITHGNPITREEAVTQIVIGATARFDPVNCYKHKSDKTGEFLRLPEEKKDIALAAARAAAMAKPSDNNKNLATNSIKK